MAPDGAGGATPSGVGALLKLALAVGRSLDLKASCEIFLRRLLDVTVFDGAAIWIRRGQRQAPSDTDAADPDDLLLVESRPAGPWRPIVLPSAHPVARRARRGTAVVVDDTDPGFRDLVSGHAAESRAWVLIELESIGVLTAWCNDVSRIPGPAELAGLAAVVESVATALQGCLAHDRLIAESIRRQEAEHTLWLRERRFRSLIENAFDVVGVLDGSGRLVEVSRTVERVLGWKPEDVLGLDLRTFLVEEDAPIAAETYLWLQAGGPRLEPVRVRARHREGHLVHLEVSLQDMRDDEAIDGIVLSARDISARIEAEDRLRRSEALHRATVRSALDAIVTIDQKGRIVDFNPAAEHMFGVQREQAIGRDMVELIMPDGWRDAHESGMRRFLETGEGPVFGQRIEVTALRPGGREFPIELVVVPIELDSGPLFTGFMRDVSEPRRAALELAERTSQLRAVLDTAVEGIITIDPTGIIESVNPAGAAMFGWAPRELIGRPVSLLMPEAEASAHGGHIARYLESGERRVIGTRREVTGRRRDGTEFPLALAVSEVDLGDRRLFTGICTDISEQRRAEDDLRSATSRLATLIASLQAAVVVEDEERRVVLVNQAFCSMFGIPLPPDELVGADCRSMAREAAGVTVDPEAFAARIESLLVERRVATSDEVRMTDGRIMERDYVPIFLAGDYRGHLWMYRDVTERRRAELELAAARERELEIGGRIQQALLLGPSPGRLHGASVAVHTVPSAGVDGDFYDVFRHSDALFDVVLGDVMGKGVPAALVAAATKSRLLRALGQRRPVDPPGLVGTRVLVERVASDLTGQLIDLERFVTLCYARVDLVRRVLQLVDCGHTRTIHLRADGSVEMLKGDNLPLGVVENESLSAIEVGFESGDLFLFYSDGVTEATAADGELFGEERLVSLLGSVGPAAAPRVVEAVLDEVERFAGGAQPGDDLSLVAVRIDEDACRFRHDLEAEIEQLGRVRELTREACAQIVNPPMSDEWMHQMTLAVNEAFTNVVRHAYRGAGGEVRLEIELAQDAVTVDLWHWGAVFDRSQVPEPSFDGSRDGGFGLYLIERSVDELSWREADDGGTVIRLRKRIGPRPGAGATTGA